MYRQDSLYNFEPIVFLFFLVPVLGRRSQSVPGCSDVIICMILGDGPRISRSAVRARTQMTMVCQNVIISCTFRFYPRIGARDGWTTVLIPSGLLMLSVLDRNYFHLFNCLSCNCRRYRVACKGCVCVSRMKKG